MCGDGRCNENIALTAVHRSSTPSTTASSTTSRHAPQPGNEDLLADFQAAHDLDPAAGVEPAASDYGGRLFQAARFVTEMEYQHLVFEEFARKIVPAIRPFHVYHPDINPAIPAEFAHAVYRFGHSMLDDDVARTNVRPDGDERQTTTRSRCSTRS